MTPLASKSYTYSLSLHPELKKGDMVTTLAETSADNALPKLATVEVHILGAMPQTGAEERFIAPLENTSRFLTPLH